MTKEQIENLIGTKSLFREVIGFRRVNDKPRFDLRCNFCGRVQTVPSGSQVYSYVVWACDCLRKKFDQHIGEVRGTWKVTGIRTMRGECYDHKTIVYEVQCLKCGKMHIMHPHEFLTGYTMHCECEDKDLVDYDNLDKMVHSRKIFVGHTFGTQEVIDVTISLRFTDLTGIHLDTINDIFETWAVLRCTHCGSERIVPIARDTLLMLRRGYVIGEPIPDDIKKKLTCQHRGYIPDTVDRDAFIAIRAKHKSLIKRAKKETISVYRSWYNPYSPDLAQTAGLMRFYEWSMENGWRPGATLIRLTKYRPYCTDNCAWSKTVEVDFEKP